MSRLNPRQSILLMGAALLGLAAWAGLQNASPSPSLAQATASDEQVKLTISVEDAESGLSLKATRLVPVGSTALQAMQNTVALETKEYEGLGLFVTSLCGIKPAAGKFWSPSVDGERSQVGITRIKIEKAMRLDWQLRSAQSE